MILRYTNVAAYVSFLIYLVSLQQNEVFNVNSDLGNRFQRLQDPEKIVLYVSAIYILKYNL